MSSIKLFQGDCLEVLPLLSENSVDFILTDPPYGTTACKWDSVIPFGPMWEQIWRVLKPNGACALFGSEPFSSRLRVSQLQYFKYDWIWKKSRPTGSMLAKKQPLRETEVISVFYKEQVKYLPQMTPAKEVKEKQRKVNLGETKGHSKVLRTFNNNGLNYPRTILEFGNSNYKSQHPTQKPVALLEYLIKTYTQEGETVLDFTMGSGSTGVACKNTNRNFIGIEKEEKYMEIARNRTNKGENE